MAPVLNLFLHFKHNFFNFLENNSSVNQKVINKQDGITLTSLKSEENPDEYFDTHSQISNASFRKQKRTTLNNKRQRRTTIPPRPNNPFSLSFLRSLLKNLNNKDIFKTPIPVNFNEPLSSLQKMNEDLEFSFLLDKAAACEDSTDQMLYVTAFAIASYSNCIDRMFKPFNPMLGETFEYDRLEDYGWRSITEQVSHHPPGCVMVPFFF